MSQPPILLAIDPGCSGGIATLFPGLVEGQSPTIQDSSMPATEGDTLLMLRDLMRFAVGRGCQVHCYLEKVGGFMRPSQGGANMAAAHTMFTFGESFGFIKGVVQTLGMKLIMVHPKTWQKHFSLGAKKDCARPSEWKHKLRAEAQRRFPDTKVTLKTADCLLLLEYARSVASASASEPATPSLP